MFTSNQFMQIIDVKSLTKQLVNRSHLIRSSKLHFARLKVKFAREKKAISTDNTWCTNNTHQGWQTFENRAPIVSSHSQLLIVQKHIIMRAECRRSVCFLSTASGRCKVDRIGQMKTRPSPEMPEIMRSWPIKMKSIRQASAVANIKVRMPLVEQTIFFLFHFAILLLLE